MATSGTYRLTTTFNDIAEEALDILQVGADGESISGNDTLRAMKTMNFMLKAWEGHGLHLWTQQEGSLFLVVGQSKYDFATAKLANTWYETTLSADEALGQTVLSCTSTANITADDTIGILLDTNDIFWTTVKSKESATVTLDAALPSAAASGAFVRNYTSTFIPVNRITEVRRRESSNYEIPVNFESRADYFDLPDKTSQGAIVQAYFSRQNTEGEMYVWPAPNTARDVVNFTYERPLQQIDNVTDSFDVPGYWYEALINNLAERLILKFGCSAERAMLIRASAQKSLDLALSYDQEYYPITMDIKRA